MGDLSSVSQPDFALIPALLKVHNEGDTGRLQVRPPQGSYGTVYFEYGEIVHAAHTTLQGLDAFVSIVAWDIALNSFRPKVLAKEHTINLPFSNLLNLLSQNERALKQTLGAGSPDPSAPITSATAATPRPASTAASMSVPKSFLNELTELFIDLKGPIADIIMEDVSYDLGYDLSNLPSSELRAFYSGLLNEISDPETRRAFVASLKALEARY